LKILCSSFTKTSYVNEEVNCTEPPPQLQTSSLYGAPLYGYAPGFTWKY